MKTILTIGGIGLIAYALYEWLYAGQVAAPASQPSTGSGFTPSAGTPAAAPPPNTVLPTAPPTVQANASMNVFKNYVAKYQPATWNGMLDLFQWNYYFAQASGQTTAQQKPIIVSDPLAPITVETYWGLRQGAGLSGFTSGNFNPYKLQYPVMSRMVH